MDIECKCGGNDWKYPTVSYADTHIAVLTSVCKNCEGYIELNYGESYIRQFDKDGNEQ